MPETPSPFLTPEALGEIRAATDWPGLLPALGIRCDLRRSKPGELWAHSPFSKDREASFHVTDKGWYCFATDQGGGALELVQQIERLNCYAAARWLLENGLSSYAGPPLSAAAAAAAADKPVNKPVRQDLLPSLEQAHPALERRGISPTTAAYLGCGYLPETSRSPLAGRLVFQVRGVRPGKDGKAAPVILTHIGRALTEEQAVAGGKWHFYEGFHKTQELYNFDRLRLDPEAAAQAQAAGHFLLVEGCCDVARLVEAGVLNAGATFGAHLDEGQLPRLRELAAASGVSRFQIWYDRDPAGRGGQERAVALINATSGLAAAGFDWEVAFPSPTRGPVKIPETLTDPGEFSGEQLRWLREQGVI